MHDSLRVERVPSSIAENQPWKIETSPRILRETAQLLEIDGAIIGRYRSYEKVAELLYSIPDRIEDIAKDRQEAEGAARRRRQHGRAYPRNPRYRRLRLRQKLLKKYPTSLLDLLQLQSLGPKKVAFLWSHFKVGDG